MVAATPVGGAGVSRVRGAPTRGSGHQVGVKRLSALLGFVGAARSLMEWAPWVERLVLGAERISWHFSLDVFYDRPRWEEEYERLRVTP